MPSLQKVGNKSPVKELLITKWQLADSPVVPICQPKRCCQRMQMVARCWNHFMITVLCSRSHAEIQWTKSFIYTGLIPAANTNSFQYIKNIKKKENKGLFM